ncbi:NAD-dependent epimerase/dehydratase family protein [Sphingomonas sp. AP4-R1]|uniref:NAD-dependent epimerase/dehydratase family protein n=1 Tax=Sphingomonas sp. AP4-R1 TaxID=2735134 RepID=UPI00149330B3|nr:NAD-dependent epimerase/dehydratase family protein [Sphingomonas sp. AP4-R1]QJU59812.1 NAD-dependent epimerase/dehydratase family protein [Sphingomonas sp. AP4-R1]
MKTDMLQGRKILVVGAAGFLGRAVTATLAGVGAHVAGLDIEVEPVPGAAEWHVVDLGSERIPEAALADADCVIHLAWRNNPGRGNGFMEGDVITNVAASVRVFEQAARAGVRRILYASSGGTIYGKAPVPTPETAPIAPIGGYGAGKASAELYLGATHHATGVQVCTLRIANPYGPGQLPNRGQGFIATAMARTILHQPIEIFGSLAISRDYVFVDDVARAVALACADDRPSLVLNVGSGHDHSLEDMLALIFRAVGHETEVIHTAGRPMDVSRMALDIALIEAKLGWRPLIGMEEGLAATVDWLTHRLH